MLGETNVDHDIYDASAKPPLEQEVRCNPHSHGRYHPPPLPPIPSPPAPPLHGSKEKHGSQEKHRHSKSKEESSRLASNHGNGGATDDCKYPYKTPKSNMLFQENTTTTDTKCKREVRFPDNHVPKLECSGHCNSLRGGRRNSCPQQQQAMYATRSLERYTIRGGEWGTRRVLRVWRDEDAA